MQIASVPDTTVNHAFYQPLRQALASSKSLWLCPELPDEEWMRMGVERVLEASPSGRAFLQEHGPRFEKVPTTCNYFAALRSARRGQLVREVGISVVGSLEHRLKDRLSAIPELEGYACFAADGHWHRSAAHDPRHEGVKMAVGHFYRLNLRTHTLEHLAAGQGWHEHDMSALKRVKPKGLRRGVAKGTRVLLVYDKAGIDLKFWKRCRQECAIYFVSRLKENMTMEWVEDVLLEQKDPRNHGVLFDWKVRSRDGQVFRVVTYQEPVKGEVFEFLTNQLDLPAGVIVELYHRRWEVEKVFDELKNKLGQTRAWGTSLTAREMQAQLMALTHNLLLAYEQVLEERHEVSNGPEDRRRNQRLQAMHRQCTLERTPVSRLLLLTRRATQRGVKFIRWLRQSLRDHLAEALAVARLRALYARL